MRELLFVDVGDLLTYTNDEMQNLMDCFSGTCTAFYLPINANKTLVMYLLALTKCFVRTDIFMYGKWLKVVDYIVYVGVTLSQDISFDR